MAEQLQGRARHEWEKRLLRTEGLKPGPNHVLQSLLRYAGGKAECWPSNESLAMDCKLSVRQIQRHIAELARIGLIAARPDMTLKTQRRIAISAPRDDAHVTPLTRGGMTPMSPLGMTPMSPETNSETEEGECSWKSGGRGALAVPMGMDRDSASDESAVKRWASDRWVDSASGLDCDTVDDLIRIAGAKDSARLGLDDATASRRAEWIEEALQAMKPPVGLTNEGA